MARFYACIQGNRGAATRMGSKGSGIAGHVRGWHTGARVSCYVDEEGRDVVQVCATHGSSGFGSGFAGSVLRLVDGKVAFLKPIEEIPESLRAGDEGGNGADSSSA